MALGSATPTMVVKAPADGDQVTLGENGADVPVTVTMADSNQFGAHKVVAHFDQDGPVTLPLSAGSTTQYTGTVHLTAMPLTHRTLTVTGTCYGTPLAATETVTVAGTDVTPPSVSVTHPAYNGPAAAVATADPAVFTVSISGTASDTQSGMAGGHAAVALSVGGPTVTARPGRPNDGPPGQ